MRDLMNFSESHNIGPIGNFFFFFFFFCFFFFFVLFFFFFFFFSGFFYLRDFFPWFNR